jgi:hypothetical protein
MLLTRENRKLDALDLISDMAVPEEDRRPADFRYML